MEDLINLRKKLHAHPELSCHETQSQKIVLEYLNKFSPTKVIRLASGKALLVEFDSGKSGPHIVYRADLDALPIQEENNFDYKSKNSGISHKCGHDGHMTLACSLPPIWQEKRPQGKLGILFQHAEEIALGAQEIIKDEEFLKWKPDFIFGLHNLPGFETNEVVISHDIFSCASMGLRFQLEGKSSHAGEPEKAISPFRDILSLIEAAKTLVHPEETDQYFLATLVHMKLGEENFGITPGNGMASFTLRAKHTNTLVKNKNFLIKAAEDLAVKSHLKLTVSEFDYFPATNNDSQLTTILKNAVEKSHLKLTQKNFPFRWSEDFGFFSELCPIVFFGIGNGKDSFPLHHPEYDFNDKSIASFQQLFHNFFGSIPGQ